MCGLNPHAGEEGCLGDEEQQVISPTIQKLYDEGLNVSGPLSADTIFAKPHLIAFDVMFLCFMIRDCQL